MIPKKYCRRPTAAIDKVFEEAAVLEEWKLISSTTKITDTDLVTATSEYMDAVRKLESTTKTVLSVIRLMILSTTELPSVEALLASDPLFVPLLFSSHRLPSEKQASSEHAKLTEIASHEGKDDREKALASFIMASLPPKEELLKKLAAVHAVLQHHKN